jgi:hypothetical protein
MLVAPDSVNALVYNLVPQKLRACTEVAILERVSLINPGRLCSRVEESHIVAIVPARIFSKCARLFTPPHGDRWGKFRPMGQWECD